VEYDKDKVDEMTLALLYLTSTNDRYGTRAWKGLARETVDRLIQKGYICDPGSKSPTLMLSEKGATLSKELFFQYFDAKEGTT
jgi:hypothetical protein